MSYKLTPYLHLLGTMPDSDIAESAGTFTTVVARERRRRGIPAFRRTPEADDYPRQVRVTVTGPELIRLEDIAESVGLTLEQWARRRMGLDIEIPAVRFCESEHGYCAHCGGLYALTKAGRMRKHRLPGERGEPETCPGWEQDPLPDE